MGRVRRRWRSVDQMKAGTQLASAQSWSLWLEHDHVLAMLGQRLESCAASERVRPKSSLSGTRISEQYSRRNNSFFVTSAIQNRFIVSDYVMFPILPPFSSKKSRDKQILSQKNHIGRSPCLLQQLHFNPFQETLCIYKQDSRQQQNSIRTSSEVMCGFLQSSPASLQLVAVS